MFDDYWRLRTVQWEICSRSIGRGYTRILESIASVPIMFSCEELTCAASERFDVGHE